MLTGNQNHGIVMEVFFFKGTTHSPDGTVRGREKTAGGEKEGGRGGGEGGREGRDGRRGGGRGGRRKKQ